MKATLPSNPGRQGSFDGIRGLAALWVLLTHATYGGLLPPIFNFRGSGRGGVVMFFFLSSFLISRPFFRDARHSLIWRNWGAYAIRRFLRVAPLYYVVVIFLFALRLDPFQKHPTFSWLGQHLWFERGDSVFWTIPIEMKFYCVLPFFLIVAALVISSVKRGRLAVLLAGSVLLGIVALGLVPLEFLQGAGINKHAPVFAAGVLTALALSGLRCDRLSRRTQIAWECAAWIAAASYLCLSIPGLYNAIVSGESLATFSASSVEYEHFWDVRIPWIGLVLGLLFLSIENGVGLMRRMLASAPLAWLGKVSFGVYLMHATVLGSVEQSGLPKSIGLLVALASALALAWVANLIIEAPSTEWGKRLTKKIENRGGPPHEALEEQPAAVKLDY
jgi:peptidoglycan/LPS O-acetylase OafA/YrhL